ncbi:hypothetical protein [Streptomyces fragilis]|uniref:hypothetical protein n=1 Tax=Streptomyces fragilis TaxID=67301 RepID=UPI0024DE0CA4|nr:hypothetical protein [Streptomyces fragilis]
MDRASGVPVGLRRSRGPGCLSAVSYTHLDVYKRQVHGNVDRASGVPVGLRWSRGPGCLSGPPARRGPPPPAPG